jgi:hypothetical protein
MAEKIEDVFGFLVLFWRSWLQSDNITHEKIFFRKISMVVD